MLSCGEPQILRIMKGASVKSDQVKIEIIPERWGPYFLYITSSPYLTLC